MHQFHRPRRLFIGTSIYGVSLLALVLLSPGMLAMLALGAGGTALWRIWKGPSAGATHLLTALTLICFLGGLLGIVGQSYQLASIALCQAIGFLLIESASSGEAPRFLLTQHIQEEVVS